MKKEIWGPTIDYKKCISCLACVDYCSRNVYSIEDKKPVVINKSQCVVGCKGCEPICPVGAISHPSDSVLKKIKKENKAKCCSGDCDCGEDCKC